MSENVQLLLVAPCVAASRTALENALDRFAIACILITPADWQAGVSVPERCDRDQCRALIELAQSRDVAAIVANDAETIFEVGGDGCHLDADAALEETYHNVRSRLGNNAIVGAMPGRSRHIAMTLAEAGADYIAYVIGGPEDNDGLEAVAWWAEIFSTPVVAFTDGTPDTCRRAIDAGPPDFLAVPLLIDGACNHLQDISQVIAEHGALPIAAKDAK